ncbi:MAG TPA: SRPBCC domain-containing protein [Methanomicrobiales archaeon]|jgi:uncharacterized protein YndB with AHSA1/START domain|nr:SRPBCC domain-containing protein [Methanomicrobiales archaeon]
MVNQPGAAPAKSPKKKITLERTFRATAKQVWELWTTRKGLESWWGPEGFVTKVNRLEVRPGGKFDYEMTATGPEQVEAMQKANLPLTSRAKGTYTEIKGPHRLIYKTLADFIPGVTPYEVTTLVEIQIVPGGVRLTVIEDVMHNEEWTRMSEMGMGSSLDRLARIVEGKRGGK